MNKTTIEILMLISSMLDGLALFLSGMNTMSDSLAAMTGGSLNRLIGKVTKNRFLAFLFGEVMELGETVKRRFIRRLHEDGRARIGSTLYTEICYVEEQLVDDCDRVADALIRYGKQIDKSGIPEDATEERQREQAREFFRGKYEKLEKSPDRTE